jgi:plastocyanin
MSIRGYVVALAAAIAVAVGCESRGPLPVSPSATDQGNTMQIAGPGGASQFAAVTEHGKSITLFDACDPDTFNAPPPAGAGPGTCIRQGGVRFQNFLDQLSDHHSVGAWHMAPGQATIKLGDALEALNRGGEVHTFTEVEEFGGGFVQPLNDLGGFGARIPECDPTKVQLLHPGDSFHETTDEVGVEKYQCCIHPWMRAEIHIVQH